MLFLWPLFSRKFKSAGRIVAGFALAITLCSLPWLLHGSISWLKIGLAFGSRKFPVMGGPGVDNLPCILATRWNWQYTDVISLPHLPAFTISALLKGLYFISLILCAF